MKVIKAPQWLTDRMEALKKLPPPTLEEVRETWAASAEFRNVKWMQPEHEKVRRERKTKVIR